MNARFVADTLLGLIAEHGVPAVRPQRQRPGVHRQVPDARCWRSTASRRGTSIRAARGRTDCNERFNGTLRDECLNMETFAQPGSRADDLQGVWAAVQHDASAQQPGISDAQGVCRVVGCGPGGEWRRRGSGRRDAGALPPHPRDLSLCAPPAGLGKEERAEHDEARPASRKAIHVGAPVASQQSRILRVDESSVTTSKRAGKVPAQIQMTLGRETILRSWDKNGVWTGVRGKHRGRPPKRLEQLHQKPEGLRRQASISRPSAHNNNAVARLRNMLPRASPFTIAGKIQRANPVRLIHVHSAAKPPAAGKRYRSHHHTNRSFTTAQGTSRQTSNRPPTAIPTIVETEPSCNTPSWRCRSSFGVATL